MRTLYWAWELLAVARLDITGVSAEFADNLGEIEPRAYTLIREMIDASLVKLVGLDDVRDDSSQVAGIGRSTNLVKNNLQSIVASSQTLHGLYKVLSPLRVKPSCTDDDMLTARSLNTLFSSQLGLAIYAERIGFPVSPGRR